MDDRTITMTVGHDRLATVGSDRRLFNMLRISGQIVSCVLRIVTVYVFSGQKKWELGSSHLPRITLL